MHRSWLSGEQVEDSGRNVRIALPAVLTEAQKTDEVYQEIFNANVGKYKAGGFPCYNKAERQWLWSINPEHIARRMNSPAMFDFHVTIEHVEQAQAMLKRGRV